MERIVICADGTWNVRDQTDARTKKRRPTNVTKLARSVLPRDSRGVDQVVIYHDGVGTEKGLGKVTGGAFGHGIEDNVRELYRSILYNYAEHDELYFFGFSRGAFTVRTLAGFLNMIGLLEKDDDYWVPELYACYESAQGRNSEQWKKATHRFQGGLEHVPIKMIGVWDTVGALGAPGFLGQVFNRGKYQYHDVALNPNIQYAYHALAIDERRKPFAPNLWTAPSSWSGVLEQVWFPGVHCNVGGGYAPDGLANGALHWMVAKAKALGVAFDDRYLGFFEEHFDSYLAPSMNKAYRALGTNVRVVGGTLGANEAVHQSVVDRIKAGGYDPSNARAFAVDPATKVVPSGAAPPPP